ncbi:MAG: MBL fold metallo-hydrolase [Syntrophales bacterium]|nr:MBL fold metallo-hydrolase [Syntrophales bacterium]
MIHNLPDFVHDCGDGLFLIDLELPRTGFRRFISAWLYLAGHNALIVDCGPAATYENLKDALSALSVTKIDYILLTHIHLDHAGAIGLLVSDFPSRVICHPAGIPHLVSPEKLEEATRRVLGDLAFAYGSVKPVPMDVFEVSTDFVLNDLKVRALDTPGHAPHHYCYLVNDILFAGEICGVSYPIEGGYLRPATPPPFRYDAYRSSLEKLLTLPARLLCFGHYGCYPHSPELLKAAAQQLDLWVKTITKDEGRKEWERYFEDLLSIDPLISRFFSLPADVQEREKFFIANSIQGIAKSK